MATSFTVNKHDLEFILKQISIAELQSSTGISTSQAIQQIYGVSALNAALVPFGIRSVDGRDNNLIPGQEDFGAADTLFPRLLDPSYGNENDEDPFHGVSNTDYGTGGDVVDSDPRTISNLISEQSVSNPAAIIAALKSIGIEGVEANNAQAAITAAYQNTLRANGIDAAVTAQQAVVNAANAAQAAAVLANNLVVAEHAAYVAALALADDATASAAALPALLQDLADAIAGLAAPEADLAAAAAVLVPLEAEEVDAQAALDAAQAAFDAMDFTDLDAINAATATLTAAQAALAVASGAVGAQNIVVDARTADLAAAQAVADASHLAASDAAAQAGADADAVLAALDPTNPDLDFTTPGAQAAATEAAALIQALSDLAESGVRAEDAAALDTAAAAFDPAVAAASESGLPILVSDAQAALAGPAATLAAANSAQTQAQALLDTLVTAAGTAGTPELTAAALQDAIDAYGLEVGADGALFIKNLSPDIGLSPSFNTVMTIFGQFFDHGLDLVTKGGNGTVYIPLGNDDPIVRGADGVLGTADDLPEHLRFMALTRATPTTEGGVEQHENTTTPWVDQNQTYGSHASHQVFLREYVRQDIGDGMKTYATGRLLDGKTSNGSLDGAIGNWSEVKANALEFLGIRLNDFDVHDVPLLATDAYGNLILGANGYAQIATATGLVEGSAAGVTTEIALKTGHQFLADIAHHAAPGTYDTNRDGIPDGNQTPDSDPGVGNDGDPTTYDDEMLGAHFVTGDGRGNENIALTAIHSVFHSEHNRVLEANKATILASGDRAFINEWLLVDIADGDSIPTNVDAVVWDGARMFQAARFSTEMQYQHMVFEEFARRIQPAIDPFVFTNDVQVDGAILAEFAHAVYRFGHSMLNSSVDRLDNELNLVDTDPEQIGLIEAFLNPQAYLEGGDDFEEVQAALIRGMARDPGNEIDEFVVGALRSNLLGLPLDLGALNIARARETGTPTLQEARQQLYNDFGLTDLKPYTGWTDFTKFIKNSALGDQLHRRLRDAQVHHRRDHAGRQARRGDPSRAGRRQQRRRRHDPRRHLHRRRPEGVSRRYRQLLPGQRRSRQGRPLDRRPRGSQERVRRHAWQHVQLHLRVPAREPAGRGPLLLSFPHPGSQPAEPARAEHLRRHRDAQLRARRRLRDPSERPALRHAGRDLRTRSRHRPGGLQRRRARP